MAASNKFSGNRSPSYRLMQHLPMFLQGIKGQYLEADLQTRCTDSTLVWKEFQHYSTSFLILAANVQIHVDLQYIWLYVEPTFSKRGHQLPRVQFSSPVYAKQQYEPYGQHMLQCSVPLQRLLTDKCKVIISNNQICQLCTILEVRWPGQSTDFGFCIKSSVHNTSCTTMGLFLM